MDRLIQSIQDGEAHDTHLDFQFHKTPSPSSGEYYPKHM